MHGPLLTRRALGGLALGAAGAAVAPARAQGFPNRTMRIIVPYTPGASTDTISRVFAEEAGRAIGQTIIVENRAGAGTAIGTQVARQAPADGHTLLFGSSTMISTMLGLKKPGYAMSDFVPAVVLGNQHYVLISPSALPVQDIKGFVAYARANPDKVNYASLGPGAPSHTLADRLRRAGGFQWQNVAYRGGTPALQAIMANEVQGYFGTLTLASEFKSSEKLRFLGIASDQRSRHMPDVPTFAEMGYDGMIEQGWYALFVRAGTPAPVLDKLRTVFAQVMRSPAIQKQMELNRLDPYDGGVDRLTAGLDGEVKAMAVEMDRLGIVAQ